VYGQRPLRQPLSYRRPAAPLEKGTPPGSKATHLRPLLVSELKQGRVSKYYLIRQFDVTEAEQYLADEFATKPNEAFACSPTTEN
jgi:hypothetical protein